MKESGAILPRSGPGPDCRIWNVRNPEGHPPSSAYLVLIRSRSHELHNPESRVRTSSHSLSHPPRIHGPESGGAPAKSTGVRCAETRIQSPESTTEAEERGADPQIPESGLRRHAQGSRGRAGAQDTGSGLSGKGSAWGRAQRGREGGHRLRS